MREIVKITDSPNQKPLDLSEKNSVLYEKLITLSEAVSESSAQETSKNDAQLIIQTFQFILRNEAYIKNVVNGDWTQETEEDKKKTVIRVSDDSSFHVNGYHDGEQAVKRLLSAIEEFLDEYNNTENLEVCISKALTTLNQSKLDKKDKPPFRDKRKIEQALFRVRVNPYDARYEVHDVKNANDSLHKTEKERRRDAGLAPLPPHQSFTYYDVDDDQFRPDFFQPTNLSEAQKREIIGIRVKSEDAFINRIIAMDRGTASVFYGFKSREDADNYVAALEKSNAWATSLSDLKKRKNNGSYNEVLLRANWCCDGSSQLLIYPPYDDVAGRYMAILYRLDLEDHFKNHADQYRQAPFYWKEGYEVPISFWRNTKNTPEEPIEFYDATMQHVDLQKPVTTIRERFLKTAVEYRKCASKETFVFDDEVIEAFRNALAGDPLKLVDDFALLNWIGGSSREFYKLLCNQIPLQDLISFINLEIKNNKFFMLVRRKVIDVAVIIVCVDRLKNERLNHAALKEMLLAEFPGQGPSIAIRIAAQNGHTEVVTVLLDAALSLKEKDPADTTLKEILLAEFPGKGPANAIRCAAQNGHTEVVKVLLDAALSLKEKDPADTTLKEMLLAEFPGNGPASAILLAAGNGHTEVVKVMLDAALSLKEKDPVDTTLKEILLAEFPGHGPANAIRLAAQNGHTEVVKVMLDAALSLKEKDPADTTLKEMLLARFPGQCPASAIHLAVKNGHTEVVKVLLDAALSLKEKDPADTTLKEMLLAGFPWQGPASAIRVAAKNGRTEVVKLLLDAALILKTRDFTDDTFKKNILAATDSIAERGRFEISTENVPKFVSILISSPEDEKKAILKACETLFTASIKSQIVNSLTEKVLSVNAFLERTPEDVEKLYKKQAFFFSFKKNQFKENKTIEAVIEKLKSGAEKNFSGASMMTLLEMAMPLQTKGTQALAREHKINS